MKPSLAMRRALGCTPSCAHVAPDGPWPHETKQEEDNGEVHTDDCGFFACEHDDPDHDPEDCCTSGQQDVLCRVKTRPPATTKKEG